MHVILYPHMKTQADCGRILEEAQYTSKRASSPALSRAGTRLPAQSCLTWAPLWPTGPPAALPALKARRTDLAGSPSAQTLLSAVLTVRSSATV